MVLSCTLLCSMWMTISSSAESSIPFLGNGQAYAKTTIIDFEENDGADLLDYSGASAAVTASNRGTSKGALKITPTELKNSIFAAFGGDSGIVYHLSFLSTKSALQAKIHTMSNDDSVTNSTDLTLSEKVLSDGWIKYTSTFTVPDNTTGSGCLEIISADKTSFSLLM